MEGIISLIWMEGSDKNNSFILNLFSTPVLGDTLAQKIPHLCIIVFVPTTYNSARLHKTHRNAEPGNIRPIIGASGCECYGGRKLPRSIQEKVFTKHSKTWGDLDKAIYKFPLTVLTNYVVFYQKKYG